MKQGKGRAEKVPYFDRSDSELLDRMADTMVANIAAGVSETKVIVTIPAHNEENFIGKCLESLATQITVFGRKVDAREFEIIVLCHKCTDSTLNVCLDFQDNHNALNLIVLETDRPEVNNVGAVRRILMRIARSRISCSGGYIAMTDADTVVHPYWMANLLGYVGSGYGLICGRIDIDMGGVAEKARKTLAFKRRYDELRMLLETSFVRHKSDPAPRHYDNSGPNMAVRADVYDRVGGMLPLGFCEDVAFYDSVIWGGHKVRHCPLTLVTTSGRVDPRAPWGFGAELSVWGEAGENHFEVEGLDALLVRFRMYKLLGEYLDAPNESVLLEIAGLSAIESHELQSSINQFSSHRAIAHKLEKSLDALKSWRTRYPKTTVGKACEELEAYLSIHSVDFLQTCKR